MGGMDPMMGGMDPMMMGDPSMMGAMQGMYDMGMDPMMGNNMPGQFNPGEFQGEFMPGEYQGEFMPGEYQGEFMPGENQGEFIPGEFQGEFMPGEFMPGEYEQEQENSGFPKQWGPTTYYDQGSYDAARLYNNVYYINYSDYIAAQGVGGGSYETTTPGNDVVYATGSSQNIGNKMSNQPYDLDNGDDTAGQPNMPSAGLMGDDFIKGNGGNDTIYGGQGSDWLMGGSGQDMLHGGFGNDVIVGGADSDFIFSGPGSDVLVGGNASDADLMNAMSPMFNSTSDGVQDTFVFNIGEGSVSYLMSDKIDDFVDGQDKIAISDDGGTTYEATPFGSGILSATTMGSFTAVHKADNSEFLFYVDNAVTFDDSDVTTIVA